MAAAAVDVGYLAASYAVPAPDLQSLLSQPTVELVQSLLVQLEAKAREYDELKSQKLRSELELENSIRGNEARQKALKTSADKALKEAEELRIQLSEEQKARQQIENELNQVKSAASSSSSEVQTLESRVKSLEAQNRDTLALHEAKSAAYDRLADELSAQHHRIVDLRKQVSELDEKNQTLENAATSAKYREQNLQREIDTLKKSNEWYEGELNTRTADNTRFRKEKNAQIAELQRANADATQTVESLRRTEATQRQRIEELDQKVEQTLLRIQQLQNEATQNQQASQAELENIRRLATLHQESASTAKARLQEVTALLEQTNDSAAHEVGQLQAEIDSEHSHREVAEGKVAELESRVEELELQVVGLQSSAPGHMTPRRSLHGPFDTPGRAGSPSVFSPGGRNRGGLSTTQLYAENTQLKKEVRALQEKETKLSSTLEEMVAELESRQPEMDELQKENDRLTAESGSISDLLNEAIKDKEMARKEARKALGDRQGLQRENEIQRQQLRDLSVQISMLLLQEQIRTQGLESLSDEEKAYLQKVGPTNIQPDEHLHDSTSTGRLISKQLLLFKNIGELQQQNQKLMSSIRELGERLEGSEALENTKQLEKEREELAKLRERVAQYQDEIRSLDLRSQGLTKERDMYRRIVTSRGQGHGASDAGDMFGQSVNGGATSTPPPRNLPENVDQTPYTKETIAGYEKLIRDLQSHLDTLRQESATDLAALRQQADQLAKENNQLQGDKMRLENAIQLANERYELHINKVSLLQAENNEIKKRCEALQDVAAKQDIKSQQVAEDLLEAKSLADSLARENANLKASRDISHSAETRLQNENASLMEERARLNKMVSNLQNLRNEQELADSENRRHLQSRIESLESELQTVRRRLEDEVEEHKKSSMLLEHEQTKARSTIDDLRKMLNNIRPELASVKTDRDHLQARVDELKVELRIAEERAQSSLPQQTSHTNVQTDDGEMTREEQLSVEISNLRHELEVAREDAESARTDSARYQAIAKDTEEQIEAQLETQEQYQKEMEELIAAKDANIRDLEKRVEEISSELAATNTELSELRRAHSEEGALFAQQKEQLEAEIERLKEEADRYKQTASFHQEDLKAQAEIATRAQENYEQELVKHSEAMQNLQREREQHNNLKSEVSQFKAQAEAARAALAQSEEHWTEIRERFERDLSDARTKLNEMNEQNKILHQQLENVSSQIDALKQSRVSVAAGEDDVIGSDVKAGYSQEVVTYIRREKEILDVQYELSITENKRLKQQVDRLQGQLDETREKLIATQQSQAQNKQGVVSLDSYERYVEQVSTLRESNTTLRNEARQATIRLEEKTKEVEGLYAQIQPLRARVQELEIELETTVSELESARQNGEHWQKRCQDILHKYDRIDPAELEALKAEVETLRTERDRAQEQVNDFEARLETEKKAAVEEKEKVFEERRENMIAKFKERSRQLSAQIQEKNAAVQSLTTERDTAQQKLAAIQEELTAAQAARDEAMANARTDVDTAMGEEGQVDESGLSNEERQALETRLTAAEQRAEVAELNASALEVKIGELQNRIAGLEEELGQTRDQAKQYAERVQELETQLLSTDVSTSEVRGNDLKQAQNRIRELETQLSSGVPAAAGDTSEDIEKLKEELVAAQKEAEDLRTRVDLADSSVGVAPEDRSKAIMDQVAQQVAAIKKDLEAKHAESTKAAELAAEQKAKARADSMKDKFNAVIMKKREENEQALTNLKTEHEAELAELRQQLQAAAEAPKESKSDVKAEDTTLPDLTKTQVQALVSTNETAKAIVRNTVRSQLQPLKEQHAKEIEELKQQHAKELEELTAKAATGQAQGPPEDFSKQLEDAKTKTREEQQKMWAAKMSLAQNRAAKTKAQVDVVEKAAKETPERPVGEVWEEAKVAKPVQGIPPPKVAVETQAALQTTQAAQPSAMQAAQPSATQAAPPSFPAPATDPRFAQPGPAAFQNTATAGFTQPNGTAATPFGQPGFVQPPFSQQGTFGRPSPQPFPNQGQRPFGGTQPFGTQPPQPQQDGRGRDNVGTGPAALRSLLGQGQGTGQGAGQGPAQSAIPRGGGIPRPNTRAQGNIQNQGEAQNSGIGRGRGRGNRGGHIQTNLPGGQNQQQSPRSLNPGAPGFQPGGGRGQKRGRDDLDGGDRGGKRSRGGH